MSALLTGAMRRFALRRRLVDVPNLRSSHTRITPRGGGLAIVLVCLLVLVVAGVQELAATWALAGVFFGGLAVAVIGYVDDQGHVAARWRVLVHVAAASLLVGAVGWVPPLPLGPWEVPMVGPTTALLVLFVVWMLNLYNFMDGIDGIAGVQAVSVCGGAAALLWWAGEWELALLVACFAAAALGFLFWNWPPAKIFMGDAGSGFLGFSVAALAVLTWSEAGFSPYAWLILLGVFIVDATLTLVRRVLRGERFYEAHRCHGYQHAARRLGGHRPVTLAVALCNLVWLLPLAWLATLYPVWGAVLTVIAWAPLVAVCVYFRAGVALRGDT
ncbi:MAG: glycosyltransferase family 4 protein [Ectothiorhodospiraceae bacterium]|nr:glycosyltransferase family 4 protein [Ectothiorhodospiraceae bacterium]